MTPAEKLRLRELARRVESNVPQHINPDAFHEEKSEIVHEMISLTLEEQHA